MKANSLAMQVAGPENILATPNQRYCGSEDHVAAGEEV